MHLTLKNKTLFVTKKVVTDLLRNSFFQQLQTVKQVGVIIIFKL